jgi:4'-phosphopantetheinyl transferase
MVPAGREASAHPHVGLKARAMTGLVHVCWSPRSADVSPADWLDETECVRFGGLRQVEDRRAFLTSRMLLKTLVGHLAETSAELVRLSYPCPGCDRSHGRPVVVGPPDAVRWKVSLSHAGCHLMVAATDAGPVGVDIERTAATAFEGFDDVALTCAERTEVRRCAPAAQARARAVYWARKEAVLKATGYGLALDPAALEVSAPHLPAALTAWHADQPPPPQVQLTDIPVGDDQVAAVAVLASVPCRVELQPVPGSGRG